jgi:hypothetical protein
MTASTETASTAAITDVDVVRVYRRLLGAGLGLPPSPRFRSLIGPLPAGRWSARYRDRLLRKTVRWRRGQRGWAFRGCRRRYRSV